jgi:hypothetical protein
MVWLSVAVCHVPFWRVHVCMGKFSNTDVIKGFA